MGNKKSSGCKSGLWLHMVANANEICIYLIYTCIYACNLYVCSYVSTCIHIIHV
jgi:hypothetical protein